MSLIRIQIFGMFAGAFLVSKAYRDSDRTPAQTLGAIALVILWPIPIVAFIAGMISAFEDRKR